MDKAIYEGLSGWIEWIVVLMGRPAIDKCISVLCLKAKIISSWVTN